MKRISVIIVFLAILICFSCEEQGWIVKCSDCVSTEPEKALLELKLKETGDPVHIDVYEGELEDNILYYSTETTLSGFTFEAGINKKYTATATYRINGNTYIAVDSAVPRVRYTKDQCDEACYFVYDKIMDLRLKYTAPGD